MGNYSVQMLWRRIGPAESQFSMADNPRVLDRRARRDSELGLYTEVMGLTNGSLLYENRWIDRYSEARPAAQELLRRWSSDPALRAAGISLDRSKIERGAADGGRTQIAVSRGTRRTCAIFFRYSPDTPLDSSGAPRSRYEAVTGAVCHPNSADAASRAREAARQLASNVLFDGGRATQLALFSGLL